MLKIISFLVKNCHYEFRTTSYHIPKIYQISTFARKNSEEHPERRALTLPRGFGTSSEHTARATLGGEPRATPSSEVRGARLVWLARPVRRSAVDLAASRAIGHANRPLCDPQDRSWWRRWYCITTPSLAIYSRDMKFCACPRGDSQLRVHVSNSLLDPRFGVLCSAEKRRDHLENHLLRSVPKGYTDRILACCLHEQLRCGKENWLLQPTCMPGHRISSTTYVGNECPKP